MACDGSPGVEKTLVMRSRPRSIQTQSVKVPPVSTATRRGGCETLEADVAMIAQERDAEKRDFSTRSAKLYNRFPI